MNQWPIRYGGVRVYGICLWCYVLVTFFLGG